MNSGKTLCHKCSNVATWWYIPGRENSDDYYCDQCVPRGCSCETDDHGQYILDEKGRPLPCCEYDFNENGWNDSDDIE